MALEKFNRRPKKPKVEEVLVVDQAVPEDVNVEATEDDDAAASEKISRQESRQQQKLLLRQRKANRPHAELIDTLQPIRDIIARKDTLEEARQEKVKEAMSILKGHERELAIKTDGSRILQTVIKYATEEDCLAITRSLGASATIANNVYAHHVMKRLIIISTACRELLVKMMRGNVEHFLRKRIACSVLEELYTRVNSGSKNKLIRELYLREYTKIESQGEAQTVREILEKYPAKKEIIQNSLRQLIPVLLNKELLMHQVVQRLLLDYFVVETPVKLAMSDTLSPFLADGHLEVLLSGATGCQVLCKIIAAASAKDRKTIIKTLKPHFPTMIINSTQFSIIITLLDTVDDTVLLTKALVPEIISVVFPGGQLGPAEETTKIALRSLLFILAGRVAKYVTPQLFSFLRDQVDQLASITSKKEGATRQRELREFTLDAIRPLIMENIDELVVSPIYQLLVIEFCSHVAAEEQLEILERIPMEETSMWKLVGRHDENLGMQTLTILLPNLMSMLETDSGFIFVVMLRYEAVRARLLPLLSQIKTLDTPVAKLLTAKLQDESAVVDQ